MSPRVSRITKSRAALFGAVLAAVLIAGWYWRPGAAQPVASPPSHGAGAIAVETAVAARADVPVYFEGLGTVRAFYTVTVTARVDGQLQKVGFVEGQTVKKGDLLAQIDPRPYQAALELAQASKAKDEAQLANARRDLARYTALAARNFATRQSLDTQQALVDQLMAQLKGDQATIDNARTQLAYTTITSPIPGRTGIRLVDPGNNVRATDTTGLVVVTQVQPISVLFTLPEDALPAIARALEAGPVSVSALTRAEAAKLDQGTLALIDNQIDQTTGTIRLKAIFPNPHNTLWPGQFVTARVLARIEHNALTVPSAAIQRGPGGLFVYVVKPDSTVGVQPVTAGSVSGTRTVVAEGLTAGTRVVTSNQYRLEPGARIRVIAPAGAPKVTADAAS